MLAHDQLLGVSKGLKFVSETNISSSVAFVDILGLDTSKSYRFVLTGITPAGTSTSYLCLQLLLGGATSNSTFGSGGGTGNNGGTFNGYCHSQGVDIRPVGNANFARFEIVVFDLWSINGTAMVSGIGCGNWGGVQAGVGAFAGHCGFGRLADGVRIFSGGQNLTAGKITVYEVLK